MPRSQKAASALAALFLAILFGGGAYNLYREGANVLRDLAAVPAPESLDGVRWATARLGAIVDKNLAGKHQAWETHALIQRRLGKSEMNNFSVIKAPDGRLYRGSLFPVQTGAALTLAEDVRKFADAAGAKGARVFCLGMPDTVRFGTTELPEGMPYVDYNAAVDSFLYTLRENDVPFLDTRHAYLAHNFPADAISPKTAFLLGGEAAFAMFTYLVEGLERRFGLELDPNGFHRDPGNYLFDKYPDFFIGQLGKETGPAFSGKDDYVTVTPKFATTYTIEGVDMFGESFSREGGATETFLRPDALAHHNDLYNLYPEGYYAYANTAWSKVVNPDNAKGPKVLVIHDFHMAQIISHLAPLCRELHSMAYYDSHPLNALEYIADKDFDLVLVSFFPQNLLSADSQRLLGVTSTAGAQ